jgi:hypothetical protein
MFEELCASNAVYAGDLVRNIKTIRAAQDLFDDLSDEPSDWAVAIAAEGGERIPTDAAVITRPFDYGTVITRSFASGHWHATRFTDGTRYGVWYGSEQAETTVHETVHHWHRFLLDSFAGEDRTITGERHVYAVRCEALLIDLRGKEQPHPELVDRKSYAGTQALGAYLWEQGANGVLTRSARHAGTNGAIFRPERLSNVRARMYLVYRCNPTKDLCRVERANGRLWFNVAPSELA